MENNNNRQLTYLEEVALRGEVSFAISTSAHDADIKFRLYLMLTQVPDHLRESFLKYFREIATLPEEEISRITYEAMNDVVPVWLWVEKCIADIKLSLRVSELTPSISVRSNCNKQKARKYIVTSAFTKFTRQLALCSVEVGIALCREVLKDNDLTFLHPISYTLLEEIKDFALTRNKSIVPATIMSVTFEPSDILSSILESEALTTLADDPSINELKGRARKKENTIKESEKISEEVEKIFEDKEVTYVVTKTFNSSNLTTALRHFKSLKEAEAFLDDLKNTFPELEKTCKFEIHKEGGNK